MTTEVMQDMNAYIFKKQILDAWEHRYGTMQHWYYDIHDILIYSVLKVK